MSDDPLTFELLFTIPRMASAYARHPDGGARMKIDIEESTVAAANAMLDLMVKHPRAIFAAAIVVVKEQTGETQAPKVRGWKEPKVD